MRAPRAASPTRAGSVAAAEASRGSAVRLAAEVLSRALTFATTLLIAWSLPVADFGSFAVLSGAAAILAEASDLGLQAFMARALVAAQFSLRDFLKARAILFAGCILAAAAVCTWKPVLGLLIVYFLFANWAEFIGVALRARRSPVAEGMLLFALRLFGLACVFVVLGEPSLLTLAAAFALSPLPAILLGFILLRRTEAPAATSHDARAVLRSAFPLGVNGPLAILSPKVELLLLPLLRGNTDAGLFAGALRLVEPLLAVPAAVVGGALPALTREALGESEGDGVRRRTAFTVSVLAAPAALGLLIVAPQAIGLLGPAFQAAAPALRLLALAIVPLFFNVFLTQSLIAAGHASWVPWLTVVRVLLASILVALLAPALGAVGAAGGFLISELFLGALLVAACRRAGFTTPAADPLGRGLLMAAPMTVVVAFAASRFSFPWVVALGIVAFAITLAAAWRRNSGGLR